MSILVGALIGQILTESNWGSLKSADSPWLTDAERFPAEHDNIRQYANVFLYKSAIVANVANHWGLLFQFSDKWILLEGIRQGKTLRSKYSKLTSEPAGHKFPLTQAEMSKNHDLLERMFGWIFKPQYQVRRRQLGDFPRGVTVSPAELLDIARGNRFDGTEYQLGNKDCQTWAVASAQQLNLFKNNL